MSPIEFQTSVQNGIIRVPQEFQQALQDADTIEVTIHKVIKKRKISGTGIIARLIRNPILVKNFKPLTREEAHERRL